MPYIVLDPAVAAPAPAGVSFGAPLTSVGKTLAGMRDRLASELGNREDLSTDQLNELINESYRDLSTSLDVPEMKGSFGFSTIAGQPFYLLPQGIRSVTRLSVLPPDNTIGGPLPALRKLSVDTYRDLPDLSGAPSSAFRWTKMLVLYPTPDDVYTVSADIRVKVSDLIQDTDSPLLDEEWHEAIYRGAKARGFDSTFNDTRAALQENQMTRLVRRKIDTEEEDADEMQGGMRPIRGRRDLRKAPWYLQAPYAEDRDRG